VFQRPEFNGCIINLDKLTYAGSRKNLGDIEAAFSPARYILRVGDICDSQLVNHIFSEYAIDTVVHLAAESHVDRSITGPAPFILTNIVGTFTLLESARRNWTKGLARHRNLYRFRFHHVSTDEVFGSLDEKAEPFSEATPYKPRSPYSASKASSDHLARSYWHTYGLPVTITNCSNNYGPYQHPEKLIPVVVRKAIEGKFIPVYGNGQNIRDWLYVDDHCEGIWQVLTKGQNGETYNIGGGCELHNIDLVGKICDLLQKLVPPDENGRLVASHCHIDHYRDLITFVDDRPGHDWRYAMDYRKMTNELGWTPRTEIETGLLKTVNWYLKSLRD
jgi:dTDP-glucose 4,6-dehydratase